MKKYLAECLGTFVLVFFACGTAAALGCNGAEVNAAYFLTALSFGLVIVAMAYSVGHISGCHINPAITLGVFLSGRMSLKDAVGYWIGQFIGGLIGAAVLLLICSMSNFEMGGANTANAANGITLGGAFVIEVIATFIFVLVVLGSTAKNGAGNLAGLAIGLTLVLIHLVCINLTGTSVNPARSFGPALLVGGEALKQLYIFILAPLVGGALSAVVWSAIAPSEK